MFKCVYNRISSHIYPFVNVYMRLKPDRFYIIPVFKCLESITNVYKRIYTFIIEFARQITRQIPFCKDVPFNNQTVEIFPYGYIQTESNAPG